MPGLVQWMINAVVDLGMVMGVGMGGPKMRSAGSRRCFLYTRKGLVILDKG